MTGDEPSIDASDHEPTDDDGRCWDNQHAETHSECSLIDWEPLRDKLFKNRYEDDDNINKSSGENQPSRKMIQHRIWLTNYRARFLSSHNDAKVAILHNNTAVIIANIALRLVTHS